MPRTHPPTLLRSAERTLRDRCAVTSRSRLLVAVSGGPDSTALLHVLAILARRRGFFVAACGINHGLREEAATELDRAEALAASLAIPFHREEVQIAPGGNLQARARTARRQRLLEVARRERCDALATGHHADDRAETLLLRLLRGAGPRGLAVLPPRDEPWIRPLIGSRRAEVLRHLERHGLLSASDPSNEDRRFLRVAVRRDLLPLMESLSPGIVGHLTALADQLNEGPPPAVFDAEGHPIPLGRAHIAQIREALRGARRDATVRLPGGRAVRVGRAGRLDVVQAPTIRRQKRP
jgi:tRNA(Ile)-lysidine synthase